MSDVSEAKVEAADPEPTVPDRWAGLRVEAAYLKGLLEANDLVYDDEVVRLMAERFPYLNGKAIGGFMKGLADKGLPIQRKRTRSARRRQPGQPVDPSEADLANAGIMIQALKGFEVQVRCLEAEKLSLAKENAGLRQELGQVQAELASLKKFTGDPVKFKHLVARGLRGLEHRPDVERLDRELGGGS